MLALRLYTGSTFRRLNTALRAKGAGMTYDQMPYQACVQSARKGILAFQAIPRPAATTFRGVTGFLADKFKADKMGMDYAFFSTSVTEAVAADLTASAACSVLFEIEFVAGTTTPSAPHIAACTNSPFHTHHPITPPHPTAHPWTGE